MTEFYEQPENIIFTTPEPTESYLAHWSNEMSILDLGCGYGRCLQYLRSKGFDKLYGADGSEELVKRARALQITSPENIIQSDILTYQSPHAMDVVLLMGVIEYFTTSDSRKNLIKQLETIVKYKGYIYLATFLRSEEYQRRYIHEFTKGKEWGTFVTESGINLYHSSEKEIDVLFSPNFVPIHKERREFRTWSDVSTPGYIALFQRV